MTAIATSIAEVAAANDVAIANDNAPDQLVLSGALDALDRVEARAQASAASAASACRWPARSTRR